MRLRGGGCGGSKQGGRQGKEHVKEVSFPAASDDTKISTRTQKPLTPEQVAHAKKMEARRDESPEARNRRKSLDKLGGEVRCDPNAPRAVTHVRGVKRGVLAFQAEDALDVIDAKEKIKECNEMSSMKKLGKRAGSTNKLMEKLGVA